MKFVIFGLTISSSWGNGHATIWRGLCSALAQRGHQIVFFEKDVPYYAEHRDFLEIPGLQLTFYSNLGEARRLAERHLADSDVAIVTSYCPEGAALSETVLSSRARLRAFYDLDTPVTLKNLREGKPVEYIGPGGLEGFDLVLSYTGGAALEQLRLTLGARLVFPLYGSVDPKIHRPVPPVKNYEADLSYLGTYAEDRQAALVEFFIEPARRVPERRFLIGGALYPQNFPWTKNIFFIPHVHPAEHPGFFCSSLYTLNITRQAMAEMGYCPSGRLFEAAACGAPMLSDFWEGLENFFQPGVEIMILKTREDVLKAMDRSREEIRRMARAARERTLEMHTAWNRAEDLETALEAALRQHWKYIEHTYENHGAGGRV